MNNSFLLQRLPKRVGKHYATTKEDQYVSSILMHIPEGVSTIEVDLDRLRRRDTWEWVKLSVPIKTDGDRPDITHTWDRSEVEPIEDEEGIAEEVG